MDYVILDRHETELPGGGREIAQNGGMGPSRLPANRPRAIVFSSGADALFGTTLQRANVTDAADARQVAKEERDRAQNAVKDAQAGRDRGRGKGQGRDARGRALPGPERPSRRRRGGNQVDRSDEDPRELAKLVRLMMPGI